MLLLFKDYLGAIDMNRQKSKKVETTFDVIQRAAGE